MDDPNNNVTRALLDPEMDLATQPIEPEASALCPLTPRSKVRKMLAALDDEDSDADPVAAGTIQPTARSKIQAMLAGINKTTLGKTNGPIVDTAGISLKRRASGSVSVEHSSDDDDAVTAAPRGRMARRLQTGRRAETGKDQATAIGAHERVKMMLMRGTHRAQSDESIAATVNNRPSQIVEDEEISMESYESVGEDRIASRRGTPRASSRPQPPASDAAHDAASDDDSEISLPAATPDNSRFQALVVKKRKEREAKEAEEASKRKEKYDQRRALEGIEDQSASSGDDSGVDRRLTQSTRPTARKASKKALEEMNRETQRMSRNMQLAHAPQTKNKITKESLFVRFNFQSAAAPVTHTVDSSCSAPTSSPGRASQPNSTAPTSPEDASQAEPVKSGKDVHALTERMVPAEMNDIFARMRKDAAITMRTDTTAVEVITSKDKSAADAKTEQSRSKGATNTKKTYRIRPPPVTEADVAIDSDSELEILPPKQVTVLDRFKPVASREAETNILLKLRALAGIDFPEHNPRETERETVSRAEWSDQLQRQARKQALQEREERIRELRSRGIEIHSAEGLAKETAEEEDLVKKARDEADDIMNQERAAAKKRKEGRTNGAHHQSDLDLDSEEDEDWMEEKERGIELSGSDEEASGEDEDEPGEEETEASDIGDGANAPAEEEPPQSTPPMIADMEASESETEEADLPQRRNKRLKLVISDDEDDPVVEETPKQIRVYNNTSSILRTVSARKIHIPGLPMLNTVPIGLTQIFAGTMDSQRSPTSSVGTKEPLNSLELLRGLSAPTMPEWASPEVVRDSQQPHTETQTQNQSEWRPDVGVTPEPSQMHADGSTGLFTHNLVATQMSDMPEPTQDMGFARSSPLPDRFAEPPPSTIDAIEINGTKSGSSDPPVVKRKGRLRRRAERYVFSDNEDAGHGPIEGELQEEEAEDEQEEAAMELDGDEEFEITADAFNVMKSAALRRKVAKTRVAFDKKRSDAQGMVEEQAEESEDEYAGLGGASGDDSDNEEDLKQMNEMLDDQTPQQLDEGKLAAFYAERERAEDEKKVEKLMKDITHGNLRRKRGANYDLSESDDDDGEARRRRKRRDFARMRKALLEDENIGKIATNPKKQAFLAAIEDRDASDDGMDFLDAPASGPSWDTFDSQSQTPSQQPPEHDPSDHRLDDEEQAVSRDDEDTENRQSRKIRPKLAVKSKKPASLLEVRASLLEIIEGPNVLRLPISDGHDSSSSSDEGDSGVVETIVLAMDESPNFAALAPTTKTKPLRTGPHTQTVIDRRLLLRRSSTNTGGRHLAFQAHTKTATTTLWGHGPPALLLRRATTGHIGTSTNGEIIAATERQAGFTAKMMKEQEGNETLVKRGGSAKTSAINAAGVKRKRGFGVFDDEEDEGAKEDRKIEARRKRRVEKLLNVNGAGGQGQGGKRRGGLLGLMLS